MTRLALLRVAAASLMVVALAIVNAQTPPLPEAAAPAAKPGTDGRTLTLGGGPGSGELMTRDELRACMSQQDALAKRRAEVDAARGALNIEKEDLAKAQEALKSEREQVNLARQSASELVARYEALAKRVEKWNERAKAVEGASGKSAESERAAVEHERVELEKAHAALEAERARVGGAVPQAIDAFNARVRSLAQRRADWNQRNAALAERAQGVDRDREGWTVSCADRRYLEADEIAIRKGQ